MLKTVVTIVLILIFSFFAAKGLVSQIEAVSVKKKKAVELGIAGSLIFATIFAVIFILLMIASNIKILAVIIGLLLSAGMVFGNIYLRRNDIRILPSFVLLWFATIISSSTYAHMTNKDPVSITYSILQVICLVLLFVGTAASNMLKYTSEHVTEDIKAERLQARVEEGPHEEEPDEEEEDEIVEGIRKERMKELRTNILISTAIIAVIILAIVLEVFFDYLPPYRF